MIELLYCLLVVTKLFRKINTSKLAAPDQNSFYVASVSVLTLGETLNCIVVDLFNSLINPIQVSYGKASNRKEEGELKF